MIGDLFLSAVQTVGSESKLAAYQATLEDAMLQEIMASIAYKKVRL